MVSGGGVVVPFGFVVLAGAVVFGVVVPALGVVVPVFGTGVDPGTGVVVAPGVV